MHGQIRQRQHPKDDGVREHQPGQGRSGECQRGDEGPQAGGGEQAVADLLPSDVFASGGRADGVGSLPYRQGESWRLGNYVFTIS